MVEVADAREASTLPHGSGGAVEERSDEIEGAASRDLERSPTGVGELSRSEATRLRGPRRGEDLRPVPR